MSDRTDKNLSKHPRSKPEARNIAIIPVRDESGENAGYISAMFSSGRLALPSDKRDGWILQETRGKSRPTCNDDERRDFHFGSEL